MTVVLRVSLGDSQEDAGISLLFCNGLADEH